MNIGFMGAGKMGSPMIEHLIRAGHSLKIYNRTPSKIPAAALSACLIATTPAEACDHVDAILSCVTDDAASRSLWFGADGATRFAAPQTVAIELSTLSISYIDEWAHRGREAGLAPIDAPVTGSVKGARAGELTAFIGASEPQEMVERILSCFCCDWIYFGSTGSASRFKLAYNMVGAGIMASFAEGMLLAEKHGISLENALQAFVRSSWAALVAQSKGSNKIEQSYLPAFTARDMRKDLEYAGRAADLVGLILPVAEASLSKYRALERQGKGHLDFSAVLDLVEYKSGQRGSV